MDMQFSIKGANEIFGQEEVLENKDLREYNCKCVSKTGVLYGIAKKVINNQDFILRISNPDAKKFLKNRQNYTHRRSFDLSTTEKIVSEIISPERSKPVIYDTLLQSEEFLMMRKKLKNLREKVYKAKNKKLEN